MHACPVAAAQVHFDALTSGLESETHFRVEEKQIIAGRYVVIQYLGSGAPPAADPSYTPPPTQTASPAAVLASCIPAPPARARGLTLAWSAWGVCFGVLLGARLRVARRRHLLPHGAV